MTKKPIIVFCGLMGSGKTTLSNHYHNVIKGYTRFNTDEVRRILGKKKFDSKDTPEVNNHMYARARDIIIKGEGVMFDSAYKLRNAREIIYKLARELNVPVLVIECLCRPETAISRISQRKSDNNLHSPTNDPKVYREYAKVWESPEEDLAGEDNMHVSLVKIDTDKNKIETVKIGEDKEIISELIETLSTNFPN